MRELTKSASGGDGITGSQEDFLGECWALALSGGSGAHGSAGSQKGNEGVPLSKSRSCAPERSGAGRERNLPAATGESAVRSRAPTTPELGTSGSSERFTTPESLQEAIDAEARMIDWACDATRLLGAIDDPSFRAELCDQFEERLAICLEGGAPHWRAPKTAYIDLAVAIVASGVQFDLRGTEPREKGGGSRPSSAEL